MTKCKFKKRRRLIKHSGAKDPLVLAPAVSAAATVDAGAAAGGGRREVASALALWVAVGQLLAGRRHLDGLGGLQHVALGAHFLQQSFGRGF